MEKIKQNEFLQEATIQKNIELLRKRIGSCSTTLDTQIWFNPNTGEFLRIGDGEIPEGSEAIYVTLADDVMPSIDTYTYDLPQETPQDIRDTIDRSIQQWNESRKEA